MKEFIECPYCGSNFKRITDRHLLKHDKTIEDYKREFPGRPTQSEALIKKLSEKNKEISMRDSVRKAKSKAQRALYDGDTPLRRKVTESSIEMWKSEEHRKLVSERLKETQNSPEIKEKISKSSADRWSDLEYHKRVSAKIRETQNREDKKEHMREKSLEMWRDESFFNKSSGYYVRIGEEVFLVRSSWEEVVLRFLKRNNIEFEFESLRIPYEFEGHTHTYIPDIFIRDRNLVLEVKPNFVLSESYREKKPEEYEKIRCKEKATRDLGYNYEYLTEDVVLDDLEKILSIIDSYGSTTNPGMGVGTK